MDISGRHTGVLTGVMNMAGNVGAAACAWGLGLLFLHIQRPAYLIMTGTTVGLCGEPLVPGSLLASTATYPGSYREFHGDWNIVLYVFVAIYLAGALFWIFLNPNRAVLENESGIRHPASAKKS
jgi:hypothetical protein